MRKGLKKIFILIFWLAVWQAVSFFMDNSLVFSGPVEVAEALSRLVPTAAFWKTIGISLGKIGGGFCLALVFGILIGGLSYRFSFLGELLSPVISLMKTVPVASFVILALIWMGSSRLSVLIVFVVALPVIALNTQAGLKSVDPQLLEMADIFRIRGMKRFWYLYRPAAAPFFLNACRLAVGMSWKAGVAAEVIGVPAFSIGEQLYNAKIYLETADLFAWTAVVLALSYFCEKLLLALGRILLREGGSVPDGGKRRKSGKDL